MHVTACLALAIFTGVGIYLYHTMIKHEGGQALSKPVVIGIVCVIGLPTVVCACGVLGMAIFHVFLQCRGLTTKEVLTGKVTVRGRTLSTFRVPSLLHARTRIAHPFA